MDLDKMGKASVNMDEFMRQMRELLDLRLKNSPVIPTQMVHLIVELVLDGKASVN